MPSRAEERPPVKEVVAVAPSDVGFRVAPPPDLSERFKHKETERDLSRMQSALKERSEREVMRREQFLRAQATSGNPRAMIHIDDSPETVTIGPGGHSGSRSAQLHQPTPVHDSSARQRDGEAEWTSFEDAVGGDGGAFVHRRRAWASVIASIDDQAQASVAEFLFAEVQSETLPVFNTVGAALMWCGAVVRMADEMCEEGVEGDAGAEVEAGESSAMDRCVERLSLGESVFAAAVGSGCAKRCAKLCAEFQRRERSSPASAPLRGPSVTAILRVNPDTGAQQIQFIPTHTIVVERGPAAPSSLARREREGSSSGSQARRRTRRSTKKSARKRRRAEEDSEGEEGHEEGRGQRGGKPADEGDEGEGGADEGGEGEGREEEQGAREAGAREGAKRGGARGSAAFRRRSLPTLGRFSVIGPSAHPIARS